MDLVLFVVKAPLTSGLIGQSRTFSGQGGTFGRADTNSWILPDPQRYVSSLHGRIEVQNGQYLLVDQSTNGIYLNGSPAPLGNGNRHPLKAGDIISFGEYEIHVSLQQPQTSLPDGLDFVDFLDSKPKQAASAPPPAHNSDFDAWLDGPATPAAKPASDFGQPAFVDQGASWKMEELDPLAALDRSGPRRSDDDWLNPPPQQKNAEDDWWAVDGSRGDNVGMNAQMSVPGGIPDDWDDLLSGIGAKPTPPPAPSIAAPPAPAPVSMAPPERPLSTPEQPMAVPPISEAPPFGTAPATNSPPPAAVEDDWLKALAPEPAGASDVTGLRPPMPEPSYTESRAEPRVEPDAASWSSPAAVDMPPVAPPASMPAPTPAPLAPTAAAAGATSGDAAAQLMAALGLSQLPEPMRAQLVPLVGALMQDVVAQLMQILRGRAAIKNEFRMNMTTIQAAENNPLKFAATPDEALENMFLKSGRGYLSPQQSFQDAFQDLADHQVALLEGMRVAYNNLLKAFDPAKLQERFDKQKHSGGLLAGSKKARYWECYAEHFEAMGKDPEVTFQRIFGEDFAQAYEIKMAQLKNSRKRGA